MVAVNESSCMERERACVVLLSLAAVVLLVYLYAYVSSTPQTMIRTELSRTYLSRTYLRSHLGSGCVLVRRYSGQQGAGAKALVSLQHWIRDMQLPMMIAEPFLQNSVLGNRQGNGVRFSDVFDLDNFNALSRREGVPEIIDWSTYKANGPRQAVIIRMSSGPFKIAPAPDVKWTAAENDACYVTVIPGLDEANRVSLCKVKQITVYWPFVTNHPLSTDDVYGTLLQGLDPSNVTLVFSLWRGPWDGLNPPPALTNDSDIGLGYKFQDSLRLQLSSQQYQKKFLTDHRANESRYVAVMIRAEHSFLGYKNSGKTKLLPYLEGCMQELLHKTTEAMKTVDTTHLLVTSDVGQYGSGSWNRTVSSTGELAAIEHTVERTVQRLYSGRWSFHQWEHSFSEATDGVEDRGYVAAVQRVLASQAACLILVGGGSFQRLSLTNYLHRTSNQPHTRCIHLVCVNRALEYNFMIKNG